MSIQGVIALLISICGIGFAGFSLLSKTAFEEVFMTTEQKIKQRLFALLAAVLYFTVLFPFLYVAWGIVVNNVELASINWELATSIAVNTLVISAFILGIGMKKVSNFITKEKTMYKVNIADLGEVYLIKMLDRETCICSPEADLDLDDLSEETFLVKMDDLMKLPILKEIVPVPTRSIYQKLFN
ncbi:hypothetical protein [Planococcus sp. 4-30]|uniref:hypothetical protein n=1 Tax=Planococcus sp. 4-30 TaxID=2874583 RepID=UPI001CBBEC5A|nr:hypothetical protein [Planococcus sp. 4-30]